VNVMWVEEGPRPGSAPSAQPLRLHHGRCGSSSVPASLSGGLSLGGGEVAVRRSGLIWSTVSWAAHGMHPRWRDQSSRTPARPAITARMVSSRFTADRTDGASRVADRRRLGRESASGRSPRGWGCRAQRHQRPKRAKWLVAAGPPLACPCRLLVGHASRLTSLSAVGRRVAPGNVPPLSYGR
jgi:hypothetical protein